MSRYDTTVDQGDGETSHALMLELVGFNKRVLDVGCATGYLAKVLLERGCEVVGVERDPEAAEQARKVMDQVVLGDLETLDLVDALGAGQFDVVVFGDVLEHLRDPLAVLRGVPPLLRPGGSVVISIPHVGHGDLRLSLLAGRWPYGPLGLLDHTHLRFFTRENVLELLRESGLVAVDLRRTTAPLFSTELGVSEDEFDPELVEQVRQDPEATTYQFVLRAVLDDADHLVASAAARHLELEDRIRELEGRLARLDRERVALLERVDAEAGRADEESARASALDDERRRLHEELRAVNATKTMRALRVPRALYRRLRSLSGA